MERIGGDADKFRSMDTAEYAASKGKEILENPKTRRLKMPRPSEAEELLDQVSSLLEEADDAALTREEVIEKVREASELLSDEPED
jgi:predicted type IV restriction endonuclease